MDNNTSNKVTNIRKVKTDAENEAATQAIFEQMRAQKELQKEDHRKGWPALDRLFAVAHRDSGQPRYIAAFLLGLYNGRRFPFDLTDLRCIDHELFDDCMLVLRMDRWPMKEVHCYFDNGGKRFEDLAKLQGIKDRLAKDE